MVCGRRSVVDVVWRGQRGVVVNAHIPQHEGRGKELAVVEGGDGGGNVKKCGSSHR